jgi:transposase InsO family protein
MGRSSRILKLKDFFEDEGIKHEFSSPYTPQQNGVVEREKSNSIGHGKDHA